MQGWHRAKRGAAKELVLTGTDPRDAWTSRQFVKSVLDGRAADHVALDAQLVVSELVTNAIQHGVPAPISVILQVKGRRAWLTVANQAPVSVHVPPIDHWLIDGDDRLCGRGLGIVKILSDNVEMSHTGSHLTITAGFDLKRPVSPPRAEWR